MGLFDLIFGKRPRVDESHIETFKMLNGYTPRFHDFGGELYENDQVRAAINARATHISKLRVELHGSARPALRNKMQHAPNQWQTWSQFLYRLSTLLDIYNTVTIVPIFDRFGEPSGIYAPLPRRCEVVEAGGKRYLRYEFSWGDHAAVELEYCGIMTKFQHKSDFFGETNGALLPTMDLIEIQNQGIKEGVKSAANYRFIARANNFAKSSDLALERQRFTEENFSRDAKGGGLLLFPNTYTDIKQVDVKPWVIDAEQKKQIDDNVNRYFGVNEDILTNKAFGDAWSAFYEGVVEAFAIQYSEVMTKMLYTLREQSNGNYVTATSNRLQYMSNADKLAVSAQMLDRGIFSLNDVRDIWNLPPVEGGDARIIRGEYYSVDDKVSADDGGNDDETGT